ncbi:MAG: hypothetical protein SXA11_04995 [Cyanobacteriota bacterium]|nr:hypothetical protein [Cyanobacteriota bacterium]
MTKQVPEPNAELLSSSDVHEDVMRLTEALERRRAERKAYQILSRPDIQNLLDRAISSGVCTTEEEAIERALRTLIVAVGLS